MCFYMIWKLKCFLLNLMEKRKEFFFKHSQDMEATKVPIKGWTDKEYVIYLVEYYLFIKNNVADFPGSSVVKNPSDNAWDMGSI